MSVSSRVNAQQDGDSYRAEVLVADGLAIATVASPFVLQELADYYPGKWPTLGLLAAGGVTYLAAPPLIHWRRAGSERAWQSLRTRTLYPLVVGAGIGLALGGLGAGGDGWGALGLLVLGAPVGAIAAMVVDDFFDSTTEPAAESQPLMFRFGGSF